MPSPVGGRANCVLHSLLGSQASHGAAQGSSDAVPHSRASGDRRPGPGDWRSLRACAVRWEPPVMLLSCCGVTRQRLVHTPVTWRLPVTVLGGWRGRGWAPRSSTALPRRGGRQRRPPPSVRLGRRPKPWGWRPAPEAFQLTEGRGLRHALPRGRNVAAVDPLKFLIRSGWRHLLQVVCGLEGLVVTALGMSWEAGEDPQPTHRRQLKSGRPTKSNLGQVCWSGACFTAASSPARR
jgi:hypothetical protein